MPESRNDGAPGGAPLAWTGISDKRSYYRLFFAYVLALFGTGIATVALALLAFDLTGDDSGAALGAALSLKMFAYVAAAPVAAALTDRLPRKPLLIALDLIRAGCLVLMPFVSEMWQATALVFVFALASATFTLVYLAVVPYLLGSDEDYTKSLARSRIASELETSASPLFAAGLVLVLSTAGIFALVTGVFLASAALVRGARLPEPRTARGPRPGIVTKVLHGPKLLLRTPGLRGLVALDVAAAIATAMVMVNTVALVQGVFDLGRTAVAIAFAIFGGGAITGALTMPGLLRSVSERTMMLAGAALITAALMAGTLASTLYALVLVWFLLGLGVSVTLTPASYLIRRTARPEDLQPLFAAQFSITNAALMLAYPAAGWLGVEAGIRATFLTLGLAAAAATVAALLLWPTEQRTAPAA